MQKLISMLRKLRAYDVLMTTISRQDDTHTCTHTRTHALDTHAVLQFGDSGIPSLWFGVLNVWI